MKTPPSRLRFFPLLASLLVLAAVQAGAYGLRVLNIPSIPPSTQKISIDGNLDDWKSIEPFTVAPLGADSVIRSAGDPDLDAMLQHQPSAKIRLCYDSDALYLALEWTDEAAGTNHATAGDAAHWVEGGEGIELHLLTDQMIHVACWPAADGKNLSVWVRYNNETGWHRAGQKISTASKPGPGGFACVEEIQIPWTEITRTRKLPTDGKLEIGADFGFNALDSKMIAAMQKGAMVTRSPFLGTTFCFLSAHEPELKAVGLMNPFEWGTFALNGAGGDKAVQTPEQSTLKSMPLPLAQSPPAIDGSMTSWDPDAFQTAARFPEFFGQRFTCHVATQYDSKNLYVAAHFTSSGTYVNIMPESTQQGFNGGDALQLRLTNGSKHVNLCGWFDTQSGKPALTADGRDLANPMLLAQGAQEQFKPDADGKGYVQQISVPWSVLFGAAPSAGQALKGTFQLWFADLTPRYSCFIKTTLQRRGAISVAYQMPKDGQLTLGLFDKSGHLLKWLVQDDYRSAGEHQEYWDGLDQYGKAVAAGAYDLKATYHPPITTDYLTTVLNPGTPSWPTPDDKGDWLSDEATPQAVATDGQWVFLASPGSEKGFAVIALDENGHRQWGLAESFNPRAVSLAVEGDDLYILFSGPEITGGGRAYNGKNAIGRAVLMCLDKKTGKPVRFTRQNNHLRVATWPYQPTYYWLWDLRANKAFSPFNYGGQPRYSDRDIGEATDALGMAVSGGKVYVSMPFENKIMTLDAETGADLGQDIPIDSPAGLCAADAHTLLAVSGKTVVRVDTGSKAVTPFITQGVVAPDSITLDKNQNVYVSDWGTSFQVKAFDKAGRFLHAVGKEGGRPWVGKWDANGMLVPRGVAVTDEGKLWVAEDDGSPKRVSVWEASSGRFLKDYIGPAPYGGGTYFWIDPKDPTEVHGEGARFKVDYDKKTATPEVIDYRKASIADPFTPNGHDLDNYQVRILTHGGKEYAFFRQSHKMVSVLQRQGDIYKAVASLGSFPYDNMRELTPDSDSIFRWDSDIMNHMFPHYFPNFFAGHMNHNYAWSDTNGDNLVQPEEMQWIPTQEGNYAPGAQANWNSNWNVDIDPDFGIYFPERFHDKFVIMCLKPRSWTAVGAPLYNYEDAKVVISLPHNREVNGIHITQDKKIILAYGYEYDGPKNNPNSIECFDMDGKSLWDIAMPNQLQGKNVHANCVSYDYMLPGLGDVVCTWLYHGSQKPFFFTTDGLYIGTALEDTLLGPAAIWSESARYFYQAPDGQPYIVNGANDQEHIFKLKGLEGGGRFGGQLSLAQKDADLAATLRDVPEVQAPAKPTLRVAWLSKPPAVDGDLSDWDMKDGVSMDGGKGRTADIALGRDKENLYLAYKVTEPTPPLLNGGNDWHDLYVSGDCVDLMLGTDPKADPHREGAAIGDERLLFSVFQGKPIAVLYKPVVPGTKDPVHLAAAQVDQIIQLDSAKVAVKRDAAGGSYTVEATVPLKDLSIDPDQTKDLRGDVGVIYADDSGKNRAQRLYYYNKDTQMVADLPTETRLQPSNWGTIVFPLGPNLLQNGGFEGDFVQSPDAIDHGWIVSSQVRGNDVAFSTDWVHSGHRSLVMETNTPPVIPPEAYDAPNFGSFYRAMNGGAGPGDAEIRQRVPVIAGHEYSVRFFYRNVDFQVERQQPGHPRGYITYWGRIDWECAPPEHGGTSYIISTKDDHADWQYERDYHPYTAPPGAVTATLCFGLTTAAEGHAPKIYLDDFEFVDVTARPDGGRL